MFLFYVTVRKFYITYVVHTVVLLEGTALETLPWLESNNALPLATHMET